MRSAQRHSVEKIFRRVKKTNSTDTGDIISFLLVDVNLTPFQNGKQTFRNGLDFAKRFNEHETLSKLMWQKKGRQGHTQFQCPKGPIASRNSSERL